MEKKYGLSQTEYEIMELFWSTDRKLSFKEILEYFNDKKKKNWKKQTLSSFLKILQDKNFIKFDTSGKKYQYYAVNKKEEHIHSWTRQLLEKSFENSMGKFLMAFSGGVRLSKKEVDELREYLAKYDEEDI